MLVQELVGKHQTTTDERETNAKKQRFQGFTALDYACYYGHVEIVQMLLGLELRTLTASNVLVEAPGISQFAKYYLGSGANALMVALLRKQKRVVMMILRFVEQQEEYARFLVGRLTSERQSTFLVASVCKFVEAFEVLRSPTFQAEFQLHKTGDVTPVFNAALFGRPELLRIFENYEQIDGLREDLYEMLLRRDSQGKSCIELAREDLDL